MFFLTLDFGSITVAALGGMLLSLLAMAIAYLVLRKCGIHFMYRRKRRSANSVDRGRIARYFKRRRHGGTRRHRCKALSRCCIPPPLIRGKD